MDKFRHVLLISSSLENDKIDKSVIDIALALKLNNIEVSVISSGGKMVKELRKKDIPHYCYPIDSNDILVKYKCIKNINLLIKEKSISLIHTFTPQAALYGFKLSNINNIYHICSINKLYKKSFLPLLSNNSINYMIKANLIIVPSNYMATYLQTTFKLPANKIIIIPNWIDTSSFNPYNISSERIISTATDFRIPEDRFVIMSIADFSNIKEYSFLITSIYKLQKLTKTKIRCLLINNQIGTKNKKYKTKLEKLTNKYNLNDLIHIINKPSDIQSLIMLSDIYIDINFKPKATDLTLLEVQSLGRQIIGVDIGATKEYILNNQTCKLFDLSKPDDLLKHILWCMNISKEDRKNISTQLSTNIRLNFSKETMPDRIINIYNYIFNNY